MLVRHIKVELREQNDLGWRNVDEPLGVVVDKEDAMAA